MTRKKEYVSATNTHGTAHDMLASKTYPLVPMPPNARVSPFASFLQKLCPDVQGIVWIDPKIDSVLVLNKFAILWHFTCMHFRLVTCNIIPCVSIFNVYCISFSCLSMSLTFLSMCAMRCDAISAILVCHAPHSTISWRLTTRRLRWIPPAHFLNWIEGSVAPCLGVLFLASLPTYMRQLVPSAIR